MLFRSRASLMYLMDTDGTYGFNLPEKGRCKTIKTLDKWKMYGKFLVNTTNNSDKNITSLFVTHHNRLRGLKGEKYKENFQTLSGGGLKGIGMSTKNVFGLSDTTLPLLPLKNNNDCGAYANNFCLRIEYKNNNLDFKVVFPGFPDKGKLSEGCNIPTCNDSGC